MEGGASQSWGSVQTWHVPALSPALSAGNQIVLMAPVCLTDPLSPPAPTTDKSRPRCNSSGFSNSQSQEAFQEARGGAARQPIS